MIRHSLLIPLYPGIIKKVQSHSARRSFAGSALDHGKPVLKFVLEKLREEVEKGRAIFIGSIALMMAVLACRPPQVLELTPATTPSERAVSKAEESRIVYVTNDKSIYTIRPDGKARQGVAISTGGSSTGGTRRSSERVVLYNWPAWSPDGKRIVFSTITFTGTPIPLVALNAFTLEGAALQEVYKNPFL